jgi:hypothetical protein
MPTKASECEGEWRDMHFRSESDISVLRCSGCGECAVIIEGKWFGDYDRTMTVEVAVRQAMYERRMRKLEQETA